MKQKQISQNWKEFELREITECLDNQRIPVTGSDREKGDVPYYGANGQQDSVKKSIFDEELLLLAEDGGSWGHKQKCSYIINGKSWVNNHAHVLRVKKDLANIKLLMYWFNLTDLNKYISGTTRGKLNQGIMKKIKISLPILLNGTPDLEKQKQIVAILERAEELKDKREGLDELFDEYLKSVFYEMFLKKDFEAERLEGVCKLKSGGTPSRQNEEFFNGSIPWITTVSLGKKYISKKDAVDLITPEAIERSATKLVPKNSILFGARVGVGKTSINLCDLCTNQDIIAITELDKKLINEYMLFTLNYYSSYFKDQSRGATIQGITSSVLKSLKIPLPPIALQKKFASIVEQVEKIKDKLKDEKKDADELFNALMQKAFSGELI